MSFWLSKQCFWILMIYTYYILYVIITQNTCHKIRQVRYNSFCLWYSERLPAVSILLKSFCIRTNEVTFSLQLQQPHWFLIKQSVPFKASTTAFRYINNIVIVYYGTVPTWLSASLGINSPVGKSILTIEIGLKKLQNFSSWLWKSILMKYY